jgi:toxin FitB
LSYLIDTNVLSELRRKIPQAKVVQWFSRHPARTLYLSVLTLGELRKGIEAVEDSMRRTQLTDWLETELPAFFTGRILEVDRAVADRWGRLAAQAQRPVPAIDSLLAATALHHNLTLVTRNIKDFSRFEVALIDPWRS